MDDGTHSLLNHVDSNKFLSIVMRICFCLSSGRKDFYLPEEKQKMAQAMSVSESDLEALLTTISDILFQVATRLSEETVVQVLKKFNLNDTACNSIKDQWDIDGNKIETFVQKSMSANLQLQGVVTELHAEASSTVSSRRKIPKGYLQLSLKDASCTRQDKILLETNKEQLLNFMNELNVIHKELEQVHRQS